MRASMLGVPIVALAIPAFTSPGVPTSASVGEPESVSEATAPSSKIIATTNSYRSRPLHPRGGIYLSIPLRFLTTSLFLLDDGTPRIFQLTSSLCVAHTGVGADGRRLCDTAIKLALDYRYVYGEEISVEELLEGLADKVQQMTMRAGSRPFGCALLVGCLGSDDGSGNEGPTMFRVDPSGAVVVLNSLNDRNGFVSSPKTGLDKETIIKDIGRRGSVAFLGNWNPLRQMKESIKHQLETQQFTTEEEVQSLLVGLARQTYVDELPLSEEGHSQSMEKRSNESILFASFTREQGLEISRIINLR